jgi:hypothetical protein
VGRIYSMKRNRDTKISGASGDTSIESCSRKTIKKEISSSDTRSIVPNNMMKRHLKSSLNEEFNKENPPTFNGEIKKGEEDEAWMLGLRKYF